MVKVQEKHKEKLSFLNITNITTDNYMGGEIDAQDIKQSPIAKINCQKFKCKKVKNVFS
ncbi:MAG: hypothetical protein KJ770_06490 [Actinobacteria bacterium]|nr:hypothetical protein [Actinomycetota bacterium]MCG2788379.1 hypothetical protein [Actinomycetes bacterium]